MVCKHLPICNFSLDAVEITEWELIYFQIQPTFNFTVLVCFDLNYKTLISEVLLSSNKPGNTVWPRPDDHASRFGFTGRKDLLKGHAFLGPHPFEGSGPELRSSNPFKDPASLGRRELVMRHWILRSSRAAEPDLWPPRGRSPKRALLCEDR